MNPPVMFYGLQLCGCLLLFLVRLEKLDGSGYFAFFIHQIF